MLKSDIQHRIVAISNALREWDDLEALRLLRAHWPVLAKALLATQKSSSPLRHASLAGNGVDYNRRHPGYRDTIRSRSITSGAIPISAMQIEFSL